MEQSNGIETKTDPAGTATTYVSDEQKRAKKTATILFAVGSVCLIVLIVVLVLTVGKPPSEPTSNWTPGFSTGVSLITSYAIDAKVRSRLATTKLTMEVANALNCSSVHMVTLQLPLNTRVTSLQTTADDGCTSNGEVQEIEEARDTFAEQVEQGLPGAFVEVDDAFTYSLQVSIPPLGVTTVDLVVEQILKQQLGEVIFEIPLIPNEEVDRVVLDLSVEDITGNPVDFEVDLGVDIDTDNNNNSTNDKDSVTGSDAIHLDIPDARQYDLPRVVRGRYNPGVLPQSGLLYADDRCFEHYFVPDSMEGMARNFFFVLDTSESMNARTTNAVKIDRAKAALSRMIDTLTPRDTFTIQSFADLGTEELWGSGPGTLEEKEDAKKFVDSLTTKNNWSTNLNEALLEGLLRAKSAADKSPSETATIMFLISDGYPSYGETSRSKIAKHVYELNKEGTVKIFTMGFQDNADMELLDAIALMNGGVSAPILRDGTSNTSDQIVDFFSSWLGKILLSDVTVDVAAESARIFGETQQSFSLLSSGYEVVVRGLLEIPENDTTDQQLRAVTSALALGGANEWEAIAPIRNEISSLCFQSYAHARVTELMRLYEASKFIPHNLILQLVTLADPDGCEEENKVECIKAEALSLAIEANLVARGLTAMVTVENETCQKIDEGAEICLDGTTPGRGWESGSSRGNYYDSDGSSARAQSHGALSFVLALLVLVATAFSW